MRAVKLEGGAGDPAWGMAVMVFIRMPFSGAGSASLISSQYTQTPSREAPGLAHRAHLPGPSQVGSGLSQAILKGQNEKAFILQFFSNL